MGWDDLFSFKLARTCHDCPLYCLSEGYLTKVYSEARISIPQEGVKAPASAPKPSHPESSWYQYPVVHPWARTHAAGVLVSHLEDGGKRLQKLLGPFFRDTSPVTLSFALLHALNPPNLFQRPRPGTQVGF
ncbi:uncharacterized protein LOC124993079 isoform X3 [Sciurus carolinensis]|uniref:uncharacterized protein LOC124993079 isoform X3 n=1 Tax=Sciurus carolinensis TaxID=30640 RepID=UPI001FB4C932|nr:uncharacterized protein LOC124993079 isoform X3 [Sciurus carolinensis]